jgi:hypothetical protein
MAYVKQQNVGNIILSAGDIGCCPDTAPTVCKYAIVIGDPLVDVTSITIDGNLHAIDWVAADGLSALVRKIENALIAEGYVSNTDQPNIKGYKNLHNGTEIAILVYTSAETLTMDSDPAASIVKGCVKTVACRYEFEIPYDAATSIDFSDAEVEAANPGDSPQTLAGDYSGGAGDDALLADDLVTLFSDLYANTDNVVLKRVQVVEDVAGSKYKVNVWLYGRHTILTTNEDVVVVICECDVDYTIAN